MEWLVGKLLSARVNSYVDEDATEELQHQKVDTQEEDDEYVTVASKRFQETGTPVSSLRSSKGKRKRESNLFALSFA